MSVIAGKTGTLSEALFSQVASYRHQVFAQGGQAGTQLDQYDRADTVYVVSQDEAGRVNGCARLLPTSKPYLLAEHHPALLNGQPLPASDDVWELSRFAAVDFNKHSSAAVTQLSSEVAIVLLQEAVECAARHGAQRLIMVAPVALERLMRRAGLHSHRAGPPQIIDGHPVFACWIEINQAN